ncbi:MAG: hypothetical protein ACFFAY_14670, partial [Promethearchaeota archaeon]
NWLAKIINGKADEYSHAKLVKYGVGIHPGPRAKLALSSNRITFKADLDLEKIFLRGYLLGVPDGSQKLKGVLRTYSDRREEFARLRMPLDWKKSKGKLASIFNATVNEVAPLEDIRQIVEVDGPTTFFMFSLSPRDGTKPWKIATKTSFPKGGPSDDADEETEKDPTFSKGALENTPEIHEYVISELLPDCNDKVGPKTKKIAVYNEIVIDEIVPPDDPSLSFSEKRKLARKRGKIVRRIMIDETEHTAEFEFFI